MSDTPLAIAAATLQFLGICAIISDIFAVVHFIRSSKEYNSDLAWLAGALSWELESLEQWGMYAGLKQSDNRQVPEHSFSASPSVQKRITDILVHCRSTIEEVKELLQTDDL